MADDRNPFNVLVAAAAPANSNNDYQAPQMSDQENDPLEDDRDLVIDIQSPISSGISALHVTSVLFTVNAVLVVSSFLIACKRGTLSSRPDTSVLIRLYTQKVGLTNVLFGGAMCFVAIWLDLFAARGKRRESFYCYKSASQASLLVGVSVMSIAIGLVRFAAYIFAHGQSSKAANKNKDAEKAAGPETSIVFLGALCTFVKVAALVVVIKMVAVLGYLPASVYELVNFNVCLPPFPEDTFSKILFTLICLVSMQGAIVVSETLTQGQFKVGLQFMHHLLQSEYATTSLAMNCFGWYVLLFIMWMLNTAALQCVVLAVLLATADSLWSFVICVATPSSPRIVSLSSV